MTCPISVARAIRALTRPERGATAGVPARLPLVIFACFLSLSFFLVPLPAAHAASSIRVTTSGATSGTCGGDWGTPCDLLYALNSVAVADDELWVAAGVYKPTTTTDRWASIPLKAGVAVYGGFAGGEEARTDRTPQTNVTIFSGDIDGNDSQSPIVTNAYTATGLGTNSYHVVTGAAGATVDGVTITAGYSSIFGQAGGGLYTEASVTINDVTFSGNRAYYGGGVHSVATLTMTNSTFTGNYADGSAGGINSFGGGTTLTNVTFTDNRCEQDGGGARGNAMTFANVTFANNTAAHRGGGFYVAGGTATLTDVVFNGNHGGGGAYFGGGMTIEGTSPVTLNRVTFTNNSTGGIGGGLGAWTGNATLNDVTFSGNQAGSGGAIGVSDASYAGNWTLNNVLITGNTAGSLAGGILTTAAMTLNNVTLVDNQTNGYGGGIVALTATTIRNSIIWGNTAIDGYWHICYWPGYCVVPTITYSDVADDYNIAGTTNIRIAPLLLPLGYYGGGIQTRALPANSPVIDAGDPTTCTTTDERGEARDDLRCDMGVFERKYSDGNWVQKSALVQNTTYSFGPALGKVRRDSTDDPGTITFAKLLAWASQPANAVTRLWEIGATNGTYNLTASLCIRDSERNGLDESSLHLWRHNGTSWEDKGGTLDTSNPSIHCVSASNVTALSRWTLATGDPSADPNNAQASTTTTVTSAPNPSIFGQSVSFTATVTSALGTPTGSVQFYDGAVALGSAATLWGGQAVISDASLAIGTHSITVQYAGDPNYLSSASSVYPHNVNDVPTSTLTGTPTRTATVTDTPTSTNTSTATSTGVDTATGIPTDTPTQTTTNTSAPTSINTNTPVPTPRPSAIAITAGAHLASDIIYGFGPPNETDGSIRVCEPGADEVFNDCDPLADELLGTGGTDANGIFQENGSPGIRLIRRLRSGDVVCAYDSYDPAHPYACVTVSARMPAPVPALTPPWKAAAFAVLSLIGVIGIMRRAVR